MFSGIVSSIDTCIVGANLVSFFDVILYSELAIFDTRRVYASVELIFDFFVFFVTSVAKFSYTSH
jgi:hypothetical protein